MMSWQEFLFSPLGLLFVAAYGAATGSFLNVVAYRLPRGISIVAPRSRCPRCAAGIRPWHNLPILGWLLLGGKCRDCRGAISFRYPLVEAAAAAIFVFAFLQHQPSFPRAALSCAVAAWALVLALIDLDLRLLPDSLTLPAVGLALAGWLIADPAMLPDVVAAAAGAYLGLVLIAAAWRKLRREEGLAAGDVRFAAAVGAIFGSLGLLVILLVAAALALALSPLLRLAGQDRGRKEPFGAALGIAILLYLLGFLPEAAWP